MAHRNLWLFALALLAGIAVLSTRSCRGDDKAASASDSLPTDAAAQSAQDSAPIATAAQAQADQGRQAMTRAVDTLHRYIGALGSNDYAKADAFWIDGGPSASSNEADLRSLKALRALRIENRTPKPLDSQPVSTAFEIPVELRVGTDGAPNRHYTGWYRLRSSNPTQGEWKITSASVKVETH